MENEITLRDVRMLLVEHHRLLTALMGPLGKVQMSVVLTDSLTRARIADMIERTQRIIELLDAADKATGGNYGGTTTSDD